MLILHIYRMVSGIMKKFNKDKYLKQLEFKRFIENMKDTFI